MEESGAAKTMTRLRAIDICSGGGAGDEQNHDPAGEWGGGRTR